MGLQPARVAKSWTGLDDYEHMPHPRWAGRNYGATKYLAGALLHPSTECGQPLS